MSTPEFRRIRSLFFLPRVSPAWRWRGETFRGINGSGKRRTGKWTLPFHSAQFSQLVQLVCQPVSQRTFEAQIVNKGFRFLEIISLHFATRENLAETTFDFGFGKQIVPFPIKNRLSRHEIQKARPASGLLMLAGISVRGFSPYKPGWTLLYSRDRTLQDAKDAPLTKS